MICPICKTKTEVKFHKPCYSVDKYDRTKTISSIRYNTCENCDCCFTLDEFIPDTSNQGDVERNNNNISVIYGVVTTGTNWKFLRLIDKTIEVDLNDYFIDKISKIIGILKYLINSTTL